MGVTTQDIFGGKPAPQPALPGSYGELPKGFRLPDGTRLGRVVIQVSDLARSISFYESVLGLRTISRSATGTLFGTLTSDRAILELRERQGARPMAARGRLGLYHFAILMPDRASLGRFVRHLGEIGVRAGAGDHVVSEAFYLSDPDGLGIEVYADRPREGWMRVGRELMMASDPVDVTGLISAAGPSPWQGMPDGTTMGHVHLHVADIPRASAFYSEGLGFDRMAWSYPGALFFGAGGYHHHLGTNTWSGPSAAPAAEDDARLVEWTLEVPSLGDVDAVGVSLAKGGVAVVREEDDAVAKDPWGTAVRIVAQRA